MLRQYLPILMGFAFTLVTVSGGGFDPCTCDSLWPHMRVTSNGYSSEPCIVSCGVDRVIEDQDCNTSAWCRQCNSTGITQWCRIGQCGIGKLQTQQCNLVDPN